MRRFVICGLAAVACFLCFAGDAQAGPIRNVLANIQDRRADRIATCVGIRHEPAIAQPTSGVHAAKPTTLTAANDCPGGKCAQPVERRGVFGLRK